MIAPTPARRPVGSVEDLLARSLRDQQDLSAVEQYARTHDRNEVPAQSRYYSDLMPASPPGPGQQYAFEVDLDRCTACKACVVACHNLNGLEPTETWRNTGLLIGGSRTAPFQQTVTTACHHCADPACMNGCPVCAYEKDPVTGIVRHLDDQCIGCKYCTLTCPYDVPKYSPSKGIVRKCDMCTHRLSAGEAPACVQACPNQAIRIRTVQTDEVTARGEAGDFLPAAPDPQLTKPTTIYKSKRPLPHNLIAADAHVARKEHAHLPLVIMLVLTQLSVGAYLCALLVPGAASASLALSALAVGMLALGVCTLHLGRPQYAFRAVLGARTSWLSREILVFGAFTGAAAAYALTFLFEGLPTWVRPAALGGAVGTGLLGVFSSVMVYAVTRRPLWSGMISGFKFFSTTLLLGLSLALVTGSAMIPHWIPCLLIIGITVAKLLAEASTFRHLKDTHPSPHRHAAVLMAGDLKQVSALRFGLGVIGGVLLPAACLGAGSMSLAAMSLAALLAAELLERYLFFTTCSPARMPGGVVS